jgi:hypothetical protein
MPQNPHNYPINRIRGAFNRALTKDKYNKLVHFVMIGKLLTECPGRYVCYRFYHNGIAVATSEPNINEWLALHGKPPMKAADRKFNKSGSVTVQAGQTGYSKSFSQDALVDSKTLQDEIMHRLNNGETITSIAKKLNCSGANICYHKRKYNERMAKQLEVDS